MRIPYLLFALLSLFLMHCGGPPKRAESISPSMGKLFIIGGGERGDSLYTAMLHASGVDSAGYIAVLPMASSEPDTAFYYFVQDLRRVSQVPCFKLHFTEKDLLNKSKLDSLRNARLIFISGGDQSRFMSLVRHTPIHEALEQAYRQGATIAGTSAGAAMMSRVMITGDQQYAEDYSSTYDKIWTGNAVYAEGLALLKHTIIDQHFVRRSRYNRLLTALCDHPGLMGVGIDESTAILVEGRKATVVGDSQVIVFEPLDSCEKRFRPMAAGEVRMKVLLAGAQFSLPE